MLYVGALLWIICGFISYGMAVGFLQLEWPTLANRHAVSDRVHSGIMAIGGPINLVIVLFLLRPYHWKL